ncbi:MAG: PIG-L family deacetylase [Candidatus Omnitrophica bacterium]|nr:PIG-L family deacetylase [Candidatus Omnitrophota bacterium]
MLNDTKIAHIYFSPHLDDAIFSCAGLINQQAEGGAGVKIITVFAGQPNTESLSAFARHLHAKRGFSDKEVINVRRKEDTNACEVLGALYAHWDFLEAPYRQDASGCHLYCTYDALRNNLADEDKVLKGLIIQAVLSYIDKTFMAECPPLFYFPMGLGQNVDHRLLAEVAYAVKQKKHQVFYYEEWPYVTGYEIDKQKKYPLWQPLLYPIDVRIKIKAAMSYVSQIPGVGNSVKALAKRLREYANSVGGSYPAERIWKFLGDQVSAQEKIITPFVLKKKTWRIRDFSTFVKTLYWHDLDEVLPKGRGLCLDVGCGPGRHKEVIEKAGYRWIGLDMSKKAATLEADAQHLPITCEKVSCVILWQVLEYLEHPEETIVESLRVLEHGGAVCGSVSFLEPLHGQTFYNLSPLIIEKILSRQGFADIKIIAGLGGFALMLWTWLKRYAGNKVAKFALPLTLFWIVPLAFARFFISWIWWKLGFGTGHGMEWISEKIPLEFAGHIMFIARKSAAIK